MGAPASLLQGARAFARDFARDAMPQGYLWDVVDYVPSLIDATLTGRGGWRWGSPTLGSDVESGIIAVWNDGDQLLFQTAAGRLMHVMSDPPFSFIEDRGAVPRAKQNPVFRKSEAIWFERDGATVPVLVRESTIVPMSTTAPAEPTPYMPAPKATVGTNWGQYLVVGGMPGEENLVRFSHPTNDLASTVAWEKNSFVPTSGTVSALAALRAVVLVFHSGTTERIRGTTPPSSTTAQADLVLEPLFSSVGCYDPRSICYWNENVVFADEHGVHMTDGAVVRNLVSQGGISSYWRSLFVNRGTPVTATIFLDYYQVTVGGAITLVCDLNKRQWFRFSNMNATCYVAGGGWYGMEQVWAGISGSQRVARVGPMYFPAPTGQALDDDGDPVLPVFETPWYRLGDEGRKRVRFAYLSYDSRADAAEGGIATKFDFPGTPEPLTTGGSVIEVGYIRSPQLPTYTAIGQLPFTTAYGRYRLPVGQALYGIGFRVRQLAPSTVTRIFDLAVEAQTVERSRV